MVELIFPQWRMAAMVLQLYLAAPAWKSLEQIHLAKQLHVIFDIKGLLR